MTMKRLLLALLVLFGLQSAALAASCGSYPFTLQNNTTADATQVMANFNTVRNCVINNAAGSGVNTDITSITGLSTPLSVPQGGTPVFIGGTSSGSANAQTVASTTPIGYALTSGYRITFTAGFTNTGATTLNVNSTGATAVRRNSSAGLEPLTGGEIVSGDIVEAIYNGTFFVLLSESNSASAGGFGGLTNISAGTTVDLGTIGSHNANITGAGISIASFGSSASTSQPVYRIIFAGINTLVYNATSLIIPGTANITTATNDSAVVTYLGSGNWQVLSYSKANGTAVVNPTPLCGASGWTAVNNAGTPNTNVDIAAASAVLINPTGNVPIYTTSISATINFATNGAVNALDTGSLGASKWYYIFLISNGTTFGGLGSLSATAPTMPSGYTYRCRLGAFPTDSGSIFYRMSAKGNETVYKVTTSSNTAVTIAIDNGTQGTYSTTSPTLKAVTVVGDGSCAPSTATWINIIGNNAWKGGTAAAMLVAPSTAWGGTNNGPSGSTGQSYPIWIQATLNSSNAVWFQIEGTQIGWASNNTGGAINCGGYRDAVNAN